MVPIGLDENSPERRPGRAQRCSGVPKHALGVLSWEVVDGAMGVDTGPTVTDPVFGTRIDPHSVAGHATHRGVDYGRY